MNPSSRYEWSLDEIELLKTAEFNPDQPRDESGKWTSDGAEAVTFTRDDVFVPVASLQVDADLFYAAHSINDDGWTSSYATNKFRKIARELPREFIAKAGKPPVTVVAKGRYLISSSGEPRDYAGLFRGKHHDIQVKADSKPYVLVHELGHAFQAKTGASVETAWKQDMQRWKNDDPDRMLVRHYSLNHKEAFAQSIAYHLTGGKIPNRREFEEAFPVSLMSTKAVLTAHGISTREYKK